MLGRTTITSLATGALLAVPAYAQETQTDGQTQDQVAQQCYEDLEAFGQRMEEEGFWLTGVRDRWGTTGAGTGGYYPGVGAPTPPRAAAPGTQGAAGTEGMAGTEGEAQTTAEGPSPVWGLGMRGPGFQIETLFRGAEILAMRGDEEGCQAVLSELTQVYDEYVGTLQEAGVEPGEVTGWRREMIAAAQPVEELTAGRVSTDEITGTEVRNLQDEYLGDIEDFLISDGQVEHVVVSHGGFLGLGEDHRVVPWNALRVTPDMNLFLLNASEQEMEEAPQVSGDVRQLSEGQQGEVEGYWQERSE